jgi:TRAP transporter TatT component family protein
MRFAPVLPGTAVLLIAVTAACSPKKMGISRMADALSSTATSFTRDNDPEFVRQAAPSTLKMVEMLLDQEPTHAGLLMTACSGFAEYSYGFLQSDADAGDPSSGSTRDLRARAAAMYDRARGYCLRALELRHRGFSELIRKDPKSSLSAATREDVPALYWTGVAWGGALTTSDNPLAHVGDVAIVRALFTRALELDEAWESGAIHEAMIALEGLPLLLGGSPVRAKQHFDRAIALSNGQSAFAYLTLATSVVQPAKDKVEFERLLKAALAVDVSQRPSMRLANLIAQRRARSLLGRIDKLF